MSFSVETVLAIVFGISALAVAATGVYVAYKTSQRTPSLLHNRADVEHEGVACQRSCRTETYALSWTDRVSTHDLLAFRQFT